MMIILLILILILFYTIAVSIYPTRRLKVLKQNSLPKKLPDLYLYSFQVHLHSQFSYDSLGKPEDIYDAAKEEEIDYVMVTDHNNDHIRFFADERLIAGIEKKILGDKNQILGDILIFDTLKVIAHPFNEKYKWQLEFPKDYLFELIDLKDAILERKKALIFLFPYISLLAIFNISKALEAIKKLIDIEKYANLYLNMDIKNPIVGGLDHHVKVYIREVGIRFLFPDYRHSFKLMRNFFISHEKIQSKEEFIKKLNTGNILISFEKKPTLYWKEENLKIMAPKSCVLIRKTIEKQEAYEGSYFDVKLDPGTNFFLGYIYKFRLGSFYFGLKPLFIFLWRED